MLPQFFPVHPDGCQHINAIKAEKDFFVLLHVFADLKQLSVPADACLNITAGSTGWRMFIKRIKEAPVMRQLHLLAVFHIICAWNELLFHMIKFFTIVMIFTVVKIPVKVKTFRTSRLSAGQICFHYPFPLLPIGKKGLSH